MKVTTEKTEPGVATLTVEVPAEEFEKAADGAWKRLAGRVNIPGFRRGKAPKPLVERHVGQAAIDEEALRQLLPKQYDAAIEEAGLFPIERPQFNIEKFERGQPVVFTATVALRPTVESGDISSLTIEPEKVEVTDEEIDRVVDRLRESQAQWLPVEDRGVELGDQVIADVTITFPPRPGDDEPTEREGSTSERKDSEIILGENGYPKGFDDQLLGARADETKEFELTWEITTGRQPVPEGAPEGTEGEPIKEERRATFAVAVKDVKRKELPALDDAFAKSVGDYESLDALRTDVKRRLYSEALRSARTATENKAVDAAIEKATFEIPDRLLEAETDALAQERRQALAQQRIALERYLQIMGQSEEDWRADVKRQAERQLKARLLLDELAQQEALEVDQAQVDEEIERTAMGYGEQADQVRRSLRGEEGRRRVTTSLRRHLAIQKLVERAGGYPPDELGVLSEEGGAPSTAGDADTMQPVESEPAASPASVD
ncbi:MAG TPA: trigger factor [Chloroflexota bacterium]|nr:trigger factor [Chloroflexota bacterium]